MSEMLERVASRIQEALMVIANGENDSPVYEHIARAAIEAMRPYLDETKLRDFDGTE
jgi:hypothetical protein